MNGKICTIIVLVGGFLIGKNWEKIRKIIRPYVSTVTKKAVEGAEEAKKFLEEQKAKVIKPKGRGKGSTAKA